ncbi:putative disease resistance RPP13-like protein 3 [Macadamia integrifolia]|uniref:putative disease resistance RPP13-like protein 3 n=1 Tax=Macadamia integrifolia TaxID=60698 RepID=UPI001C4E7D9B|nr:putative disease resistance RPP13-like protein 3 [Macadamia integrifolia]
MKKLSMACVSKDFSIKDVFKRLIKEVKPNLSTEEIQEMGVFSEEVYLEDKLRELLKDCTYLVVLDDIWDSEAWESLKRAFPQQSKSKGRVILTSRNRKVAKECIIHHLQTLNETDSWKLFVVKAFGNGNCPTITNSRELLGKEMVKKCDGLPLAITVLAGLLRGKSPQEWFTVRDRIHQQSMMREGQGKNNLEKIMSLSYNDLPYQLESITNIKLLRVLDLSKSRFQDSTMRLPDALGKLIHLRYLLLPDALAKLPSSIESLRSLQTLDFGWSTGCRWSDIAVGALSKLTQLRHLSFSWNY